MSNDWKSNVRQTILAALLVALFGVGTADATLLHQWLFQGPGDNVLKDSAGGLDLNYAPGEGNVGGVMGKAYDVAFEKGFNDVTHAYRPYYVDVSQSSTAGAGLTGSGFTSPSQFTIEAIVKPDAKTSGSAVNYLFQTRPGSDRGYYLIQDEDNLSGGSIGGIGSIIGNNFGDVAIGAEYDANDTWIYIAAVIDLTTSPGQAVADVYAANLSAGETTPTLILNDRTWNSADPSALAGATGIFGLGNFAIDRDGDSTAEASQEWFQGAIDYVAIYDELLTPADLADNLNARINLVPEPSTLALVGLAGVLGLCLRRSKC
ncbi:PEP-CTERM sorting domain-containing protein [Aeoliella sp. ICT_H6.2]|uniref:PEP-CTERM sorting domain-containing protein n=1 Tax=Aeoliella straminimaris TaxID=2954799 RepID=A0A9X2FDS2_9BACT|nr:PEP-CTERM sorting domain-containing protein [Aeoliella straminimaris]MCO6044479.1 PEP-CTERM sorting domain-containing protein [Aeoliella straminimaris]